MSSNPMTPRDGDLRAPKWRDLQLGAWFYLHCDGCEHEHAVMERTEGGYRIVASSPWRTEQAREQMQRIAALASPHEAQPLSQQEEQEQTTRRRTTGNSTDSLTAATDRADV